MIERIIRASASRPALAIILALAGTIFGTMSLQNLRRDVFPDLSAPVFNVIVQNAAMGAEELETGIAIPLEAALAGLPDIRRIRSVSQLGVCQVTVEFEPDADYYRARQFVAERVNQIGPQLPPGTEPPLLSGVTGRLNEIFEFTLEADPGAADLMTLRDLAEFDVKNRLLAVPGVAAVERLGGYLRQFQVQLDPERMAARRVSLDEVMHAVETSNVNASGGFVRQGPMEWSVRALGRAAGVDELRQTVVVVRGTTPVLIGDVADVREAPATRRGMAHRLKGEVVSARIIKQFGSDTVKVAAGIRQAVVEIQRGLPKGVVLRIVYDQSALVQSALGGVGRAVLLGAAFVVLVLFVLLGDVRAAIIVTLTIPMSIALAGILLDRLNVGLNTMTLGGLAIAVGLLVDAAIIVTENIVHRLTGTSREQHKEIAVRAAIEVGRPIAFATVIVIAVFLPLFGMSGIEGRMYQPLAAAVMAAVAASLLLALSVVPVVGELVLRPKKQRSARGRLAHSPDQGGVRARPRLLPEASPRGARHRGGRHRAGPVRRDADRLGLHAAARRRRAAAADRPAAGGIARRGRSAQSPRRRPAARDPGGRRRGATDGTRGGDRRSDAAHHVRRARRPEGGTKPRAWTRSRTPCATV